MLQSETVESPDLFSAQSRRSARERRVRAFVEAPLRRPLRVAVPTIAAVLAAGAFTFLLRPQYRASARVQAEWAREADESSRRLVADEADRRLQAVRLRVLGLRSIERVLEAASEHALPGHEATPRSERVQSLLGAVGIKAEGADVFSIECVHRDPAMAAFLADRLAKQLVEDTASEPPRAIVDPGLLNDRVVAATRSLEQLAAAVRRFQEGTDGGGTAEPGPTYRSPRHLPEEVDKATLELAAARERADRLRLAIEKEGRRPAADDTPAELAQLRTERDELRKRYTDEHPDVERLNRRIRRLEGASVPNAASTPSARLVELQARLQKEEDTIAAMERARESVEKRRIPPSDLPGVAASALGATARRHRLEELTREYERAQAAHSAIVEQWRAAETASRLNRGQTARFELLGPAEVPGRPFWPNRVLFVLIGLVVGLLSGMGAAVIAELRDQSVKEPEELESLLQMPVLVTISEVRSRGRRS
jgi:uncharacterized protein involved in exopolysaccharide biosynthesis